MIFLFNFTILQENSNLKKICNEHEKLIFKSNNFRLNLLSPIIKSQFQ